MKTGALIFTIVIFAVQSQAQDLIYKVIDSCKSCGVNNLFTVDIDNDGATDIITQSTTNISWFRYNEDASGFTEKMLYSLENDADQLYTCTFTDWDNDGDFDILYRNIDAGWLENQMPLDPPFKNHLISTNVPGSIFNIQNSDINNDGLQDIVFCSVDPSGYDEQYYLGWLQNNNSDAPLMHLLETSSIRRNNIIAGDLDMDGDNDIISLAGKPDWQDSPTNVVYLNEDGSGNFHFSEQNFQHDKVDQAILSDCDNDGDADILYSFLPADVFSAQTGGWAWIENTGTTGFSDVHYVDTLYYGTKFTVSDFDADGDEDFISSYGGSATLFNNDGTGNYTLQPFLNTEGDTISVNDFIITGDLNNDLLPDLIGRDNVHVFTYTATADPLIMNNALDIRHISAMTKALRVADCDNDGLADMIILGTSGDLTRYEFDAGQQNFVQTATIEQPEGYTNYTLKKGSVYLYDFDIDGDTDILAMKDEHPAYFENTDGEGNFIFQFSLFKENYEDDLMQDIDLDGDMDYFFFDEGYEDEDQYIGWMRNDISSGGSFTVIYLLEYLEEIGRLDASDYDGDGDIDLLYSSLNDIVINVLVNDGSGNYSQFAAYESGTCTGLLMVDNDNDGDDDLFYRQGIWKEGEDWDTDGTFLYVDELGSLLLTNDGIGYFSNSQILEEWPFGWFLHNPVIQDINNDGFKDIYGSTSLFSNDHWQMVTRVYYYDPLHGFVDQP